MKKTINNIFDEATPNELENLIDQNTAADVTADVLSSVKNKVYAQINLNDAKPKKSIFFRWQTYAAAICLLLILTASIVIPLIYKDNNTNINSANIFSPISVTTSDINITGKQMLFHGNTTSNDIGEAIMVAPGFEIQTVIEAEIIEVLPDTYCTVASNDTPLHIAKLRVIDQIRGNGFPTEIFLSYPFYDAHIFDGYERFILSIEQVGIENYMLINSTQSKVSYFSNMFEVRLTSDLGYGSVIAFNDGKVDTTFWDKANHLTSKDNTNKVDFKNLLSSSNTLYPASEESTISEVKSNILKLAAKEYINISTRRCDYITADDVFISDEAKEVKAYLEPNNINIFTHYLTSSADRVAATYTRVINGFLTNESICINNYNSQIGNVSRTGESYTVENLSKIPNIGEALSKIQLSEMTPPHIKITPKMSYSHSKATGVYRKSNGKVYGIIRVLWYYKYDSHGYKMDDMYCLYNETGHGTIVERDDLRKIIGDDLFISDFSYEGILSSSN